MLNRIYTNNQLSSKFSKKGTFEHKQNNNDLFTVIKRGLAWYHTTQDWFQDKDKYIPEHVYIAYCLKTCQANLSTFNNFLIYHTLFCVRLSHFVYCIYSLSHIHRLVYITFYYYFLFPRHIVIVKDFYGYYHTSYREKSHQTSTNFFTF